MASGTRSKRLQAVNVQSKKTIKRMEAVQQAPAVSYSLRKCDNLISLNHSEFTKVDEIKVDFSRGLCYYNDKLYLTQPII